MRHILGAVVIGLIGAGGALAEPMGYSSAKSAVINASSGIAVVAKGTFLQEKEMTILKGLESTIPYYGAVALSPTEGLYVDWLQAAGQHHSRKSARNAAFSHCERSRKRASAKCQIVMEVLPKGYKQGRALELSAPANAALRGDYRKLKSPKAFAISDTTGNFGLATGDGARALAACKSAETGASDCRVVVAD